MLLILTPRCAGTSSHMLPTMRYLKAAESQASIRADHRGEQYGARENDTGCGVLLADLGSTVPKAIVATGGLCPGSLLHFAGKAETRLIELAGCILSGGMLVTSPDQLPRL